MNEKLDTRLTDYALGELDDAARAEIKERLADDADAQREVDEIARLGAAMRKVTSRPRESVEARNTLLKDIIAAHLESQQSRAAAEAATAAVVLPPSSNWSAKVVWYGVATVAATILLTATLLPQIQPARETHRGRGGHSIALENVPSQPGADGGADDVALGGGARYQNDTNSVEIGTKLELKIVPSGFDTLAGWPSPPYSPLGGVAAVLPGVSSPQWKTQVINPRHVFDLSGGANGDLAASGLQFLPPGDYGTPGDLDANGAMGFDLAALSQYRQMGGARSLTPGLAPSLPAADAGRITINFGPVAPSPLAPPFAPTLDHTLRDGGTITFTSGVKLQVGGSAGNLALGGNNSLVGGTTLTGDFALGLAKVGAGSLTLDSDSTYTGVTSIVNGGTLILGNSRASGGAGGNASDGITFAGTTARDGATAVPPSGPMIHAPAPADQLRENGRIIPGRYGESQLQREVALNVGTSLDRLRAKYGPNHPKTRELEAKFKQLQENAAELDQAVNQTPGLQQHNTEAYDSIVENPFTRALDVPLSTFSIDVDTASYSNVRRFLNQGQLPPRGAVRVEEFLNYFNYSYPQPKSTEPFSITTEAVRCPWNASNVLVRVGLKGREVHAKERPATNLVFLVDVSGSMSDPDKLPLVRESLKMLVRELGDNDRVAIVVYAGSSGLVLPSTGGQEKAKILAAINKLEAGGSTNGGEGIQLAYDIAVKNFIKAGVNRVVLATDGDFNVGLTSESDLVDLIEQKAKTGVFFSGLAYGTGNLKDATLEKLADKGNGNYAYIDSLAEARKVLVEQMSATLVTIAKDVKVQIEFNPFRVEAYRLIGYENRVLAAQDFNNDRKDAGEIGAGHTVTALYEVVPVGITAVDVNIGLPAIDPLKYQKPKPKPKPDPSEAAKADELLTLKLRYKQPDGNVSKLIERPLKNDVKDYAKASVDFKFAAAVASFGMQLRDSQYSGTATFDAVLEQAQGGIGRDEGGYRREFLELVRKARELKPQSTQPR